MEIEDGASNADSTECAAGVQCSQSEVLVNGVAVGDGNDVAKGVQCLKNGDLSNGAAIVDRIDVADVMQCMKSEVLDNGVTIANGVDVAQGVGCSKSQCLISNNAEAIAGGSNAIGEFQSLKCDVLDNEVKIAEGNYISEGAQHLKSEDLINEIADAEGINVAERVQCFQSESANNWVATANGNGVAEGIYSLNSESLNDEVKIVGGKDVSDGVEHLKSEDLVNEIADAEGINVAERVQCLQSESVNNRVATANGNGVAEGFFCLNSESLNNEVKIAEGNDASERFQHLKSEDLINEIADAEGINVAERVQCLQSESVNNGLATANGNGVAEGVFCLNSEALNNETTVADGSDVAKGIHCLKSEAVNKEMAVADRNDVTEGIHCLKSEAVNNEMAVADGNDVTEGIHCLQSEATNSWLAIPDGNDITEGSSCAVDGFQTYKRRKHLKWVSESKVQDDCRACVEVASHLADQETQKIVKDGCDCSSQSGMMYHRSQDETQGHSDVLINGWSGESNDQHVTKMCERALFNILASEKFSLLHKVFKENFSGRKAESVLDFSVLNSRIRDGAYEQSPSLFLSDIQQVWRKLEEVGNEIVSLARSLSSMSRTSYYERVGVSVHSAFEDEKPEFCNGESSSHMEPEQAEDSGMHKICTCRHCGGKTAGIDCLVCDSCEEIYHISCLEPTVKGIPHKSWYCANCTVSGIASPHDNCVVCERLDIPETVVGGDYFPTNEETLFELEENSYCTSYERIQVSRNGEILCVCKICGNEVDNENLKICSHDFCDKKYYHVHCLTSKQLKSYGPRWYCPSCICRVCLTDQDDDQIVLCDGCDHAYHIYCMEPPRTTIPKGKWFCRKCDAGIQAIRRAKKAYENYKRRKTGQDSARLPKNIEKNWNNKRGREVDKGEGMDMLLTAAQKLNCEEKLAAIQIESHRM